MTVKTRNGARSERKHSYFVKRIFMECRDGGSATLVLDRLFSRLSCGTASHLVNAQRRVIGVVWNEEFAVENRTSTREKIFQRSFHVWRQIFLEFGVSLDKFLSLISEVREKERERETERGGAINLPCNENSRRMET